MPVTSITDAYQLVGAPLAPGFVTAPNGTLVPIRGYGGGRILHVDSAGFPGEDRPNNFYTALGGVGGALEALEDRANKGDLVLVYPGHSENVSAADYFSHMGTAAGFSVVGLGIGGNRPSLTWTVAGATFLMDTANVELANFRLFLAGAHAAGSALTVAAPITVSGNGCRIVGCDIKWGFDADQIVGDGITVTGDQFEFVGNRAHALVAAVPSNTFLTLTGADDCIIAHNDIMGATDATTRGVVDVETTECLRMRLEYNYISNLLAVSTIAFSPLASSTGICRRNDFFVDSGILPVTAALLEWHENFTVNDAGEAGVLVGTPSA